MNSEEIHSCPELMAYIQKVGFLPLLDSGIVGYSAEDIVDDDCRYVMMPDGGWDWPLWKWKGPIVQEGDCVYGKFTRLQMACRIITEDFVYPLDKHNNEYGWGWSLLTIPEQLLGREACQCPHSPEESYQRLLTHFQQLLPQASDKQIRKLIG